MLISFNDINQVFSILNIQISGAFHVGAHDCEEMDFYASFNIQPESIVWIDAIPDKIANAKMKGIPNVYHAVISDKDDETITFNISNNGQSSSIFPMGTHAKEYPSIHYIKSMEQKTTTIDSFFKNHEIDASKYDFWNFDIQGAELNALKGAQDSINYAKAIYLEVNQKELYVGCGLIDEVDQFLLEKGFKRVLTSMTWAGWGDALYVREQAIIDTYKKHGL